MYVRGRAARGHGSEAKGVCRHEAKGGWVVARILSSVLA